MDTAPQRYGMVASALHQAIASNLTKLLLILHVLAALKHQFWNRDGVLRRMSPF